MVRYSVITEKNPREIVLLRGSGCRWKKCRFCDYHLDFSKDEEANYRLNQEALSNVTGAYHSLEVINSGSFCELDDGTMDAIETVCREKKIDVLRFESHWMYRKKIPLLSLRTISARKPQSSLMCIALRVFLWSGKSGHFETNLQSF